MKQHHLHWHILGAGAIGGLWACRARQNHQPVTLVLKGAEQLAEYQSRAGLGLRDLTTEAKAAADCVPVTAVCPDHIDRPIDHLLVCTKAQQTVAALAAMGDKLSAKATVVLLQNGLGVAGPLSRALPEATILQASTTEGAFRDGPFSVCHAGRGQTLLGQSADLLAQSSQQPIDPTALARLAESLSFAPLTVTTCPDIDQVLWQKLAVNCAINPLTVKYRCRNGELLSRPQARQELRAVVEEITQLQPDASLFDRVCQVARDTAANRSSMLQDIEAGRHTEIDFITGYLCQLATQQQKPVPLNRALLDLIKSLHP